MTFTSPQCRSKPDPPTTILEDIYLNHDFNLILNRWLLSWGWQLKLYYFGKRQFCGNPWDSFQYLEISNRTELLLKVCGLLESCTYFAFTWTEHFLGYTRQVPAQLHWGFQALHGFWEQYGRLPGVRFVQPLNVLLVVSFPTANKF